MSTKEVIERLRYCRPETTEDLLIYCRFPLEYVGGGAFREVYHILGTNLVVKVPTTNPDLITELESNRFHARVEYGTWKKIMRSKKRYVELQPHMPEFHYFSHGTGIALVEKYNTLSDEDVKAGTFAPYISALGDKISRIFPNGDSDVYPDKSDNIGLSKSGEMKVLDLGCFGSCINA